MHVHLSDDGFVCCTLDGKNKAFLRDCYGIFDGFKGRELFVARYNRGRKDWAYPEVGTVQDHEALSALIENAEKHGITVEQAVYDLRDRLGEIAASAEARRKRKEEAARAKERWDYLCKKGCKGCEHLTYDLDSPHCGYSGKYLGEEMTGAWDGLQGVYDALAYTPKPDEDCKYYFNSEER